MDPYNSSNCYQSLPVSSNPVSTVMAPEFSSNSGTNQRFESETAGSIYSSGLDTDTPSQTSTGYSNKRPSYSGIYSSSGLDVLGLLAKVINRPNPQVQIGPIDFSCSFLVVDATQPDFPIIYASSSFEKLSQYSSSEIIGNNCRFLQAPNGSVAGGSLRKFTDNLTVLNIKQNLSAGKDHQTTIVNYKKNGDAFLNLLTQVPVFIDNKLKFIVGFQVDLIDQPSAILQKMQDGTYAVSYNVPTIPQQVKNPSNMIESITTIENTSNINPAEVYESIVGKPRDKDSSKVWAEMLVDHLEDFVHVVTSKGVFLYVSNNVSKVFGYQPEEMVGKAIPEFCHSTEVTPTLRELRESSNQETLSLIYRIRHKNGELLWIEATGSPYFDKKKNKKCIILNGKIRKPYQLSSSTIKQLGGFTENEVWTKLSTDGIILYSTSKIQMLLGYKPEEFIGSSLYSFFSGNTTCSLTMALSQAKNGIMVRLRHSFRTIKGQMVNVVSYFHPGNNFNIVKPSKFILCNSRTEACNNEKQYKAASSVPSPQICSSLEETSDLFSTHFNNPNSNWKMELHNLKTDNIRLREQIEKLENKNKGKRKASDETLKICLKCHTFTSPEWRKGPKGPKTLCNSCGIKYARECAAEKNEVQTQFVHKSPKISTGGNNTNSKYTYN